MSYAKKDTSQHAPIDRSCGHSKNAPPHTHHELLADDDDDEDNDDDDSLTDSLSSSSEASIHSVSDADHYSPKIQPETAQLKKTTAPQLARDMSMGSAAISYLVVGMAMYTGLGWWFDEVFDSKPWGMIVGLLIGFVAGVRNIVKHEERAKKSALREQQPEPTKPSDKVL